MTKNAKTARDTLTVIAWQHDGTAHCSVKGYPYRVFNPQNTSLLRRKRAEQFGFDNKIKNKTSVSADPLTGKTDLSLKWKLLNGLLDFLEAPGDGWDMRAEGSGGQGGADAGMVLMALMNVKGWTVEKANARVEAMAGEKGVERKDVLASLAKEGPIILEVASIKAKRAALSALSANSLLDEMCDDDGDDDDDDDGDDDDNDPEAGPDDDNDNDGVPE